MEPVYVIAPTAVVGALVYSVVYTRHHMKRVAAESIETLLTEKWGAAFRLTRKELLATFWMGQLYDGPAFPEYYDNPEAWTGPLAQLAAPVPAATNLRPRRVQVYLGLTTRNRLVVGRSAQRGPEDEEVTPHSEWIPGSQIYFARDIRSRLGNPPMLENGYRARPYFVMFGSEPGSRLPVWVPADAAAELAAWRVPRQKRAYWAVSRA